MYTALYHPLSEFTASLLPNYCNSTARKSNFQQGSPSFSHLHYALLPNPAVLVSSTFC